MNRVTKIVLSIVVLAALGVLGFVVFEHFERGGVAAKGERPCASLDTVTGTPTLPSGLTLPDGQKLLAVQTQGKTTLVTASTSGTRDDVVQLRDALVTELAKQGYTQTSTDQEPGFEAEAQLAGTAEGSLRVRPLCEGRLEIRYTLRG